VISNTSLKKNGTFRSSIVDRKTCPLCEQEGRDTAGDNLAVYDDGHEYCYAGHGLIKGDKEDFILVDRYTYEYLPHRGLSKEILTHYDIKTKVDFDGKPVADGFLYPNGEYKTRPWDKKTFVSRKGHPPVGLFGRDKFSAGSHKYVTITEGEYDAPSLAQVLWSDHANTPPPVVSVQSSSTCARDCTVDRDWLNSFERIYLCFDNDERGREAVASVARLFDYSKVFVVRLTKYKDANEYLQAGEGEELRKIWWNSKQYLPDTIKSSFEDFRLILSKPKKVGIPYPWKTLTDMTFGIRTGETVLITAQEKVGKTELMHFIEHKLLKETKENVGAIFLEEEPQRHLHALAGIELGVPIHLPGVDRPAAEIFGALEEVVGRDERLHVYSRFGSDDPMVFLDTIRFLATARACKYILLDHISIVVSGINFSGDERRNLDWFSTRLEMLVKELDIALIVVSHVNDENKTRGSRFLTKVFDITIHADRDSLSLDPVVRNTINLTVVYSRYPGDTGPAGNLVFNRDTYSFTERAANDNATEIHRGIPTDRAA
jgi:twinkle protein